MRNKIITTAITLFLAAVPILSQSKPAAIGDLNWLAGCWEISKPDQKMLISEHWMAATGDAMLGMSRTIRDGKMVGFEYLRIVQTGDAINYISKPSQNKEDTAFKLMKLTAGEVVFENLAHDFPQRIIYRFTKPDSLFARVESVGGEKTKGIDFPMVRVKCS